MIRGFGYSNRSSDAALVFELMRKAGRPAFVPGPLMHSGSVLSGLIGTQPRFTPLLRSS